MTVRMEVRVELSALYVALLRAGEYEAAEALMDWAGEWLDLDPEQLEEEFESDA